MRPNRSATYIRLPPGATTASSGSANDRSGNAGAVMYGVGGSGLPLMREVVQGLRCCDSAGCGATSRSRSDESTETHVAGARIADLLERETRKGMPRVYGGRGGQCSPLTP